MSRFVRLSPLSLSLSLSLSAFSGRIYGVLNIGRKGSDIAMPDSLSSGRDHLAQ
jgi:hypothetical protein